MKLFFWVILSVLLVYFVLLLIPGYPPVDEIPFYQDSGVSVIAHRGGRALVPGNTIEAAKNAVDIGSDIIEIAVRLTVDNALVVRHDTVIDTTTNGSGLIANMALSEIQRYDVGFHEIDYPDKAWKTSLRVPSLKSLFTALPNQRYLIELKPKTLPAADALCQLILEHKLQNQVLVGSFHSSVLQYFRRSCPSIPTSLGKSEITLLVLLERIKLGHLFNSPGYSIQVPINYGDFAILTPGLVKLAQNLNMHVDVWTVNDPVELKIVSNIGVDGIITDRPDIAISLRDTSIGL
ncbi:MAG: glycerophosphodiester phosphodiesterase [Porticoccaceae bacterium]|nr:glycerophosphodiester phosphodiesterase [Porticoccaceae bacterium]